MGPSITQYNRGRMKGFYCNIMWSMVLPDMRHDNPSSSLEYKYACFKYRISYVCCMPYVVCRICIIHSVPWSRYCIHTLYTVHDPWYTSMLPQTSTWFFHFRNKKYLPFKTDTYMYRYIDVHIIQCRVEYGIWNMEHRVYEYSNMHFYTLFSHSKVSILFATPWRK